MTRTEYPRLGETVFRETLPSGLRVEVVQRRGFSKKCAYVGVNYGSIHTDFTFQGTPVSVPAGTAHYLEHRMFDLPGRDPSAEFAALGASVNAFTSYDMTAYYFTCVDAFPACLKLLLEMVATPWFPAEAVERERSIIGQEITMNDDNPDSRIFDSLTAALYQRHPVRIPILGTADTVAAIKSEILTVCHQAFYTPANLVLTVVGDVNPEEVTAIAASVLPERRPTGEKRTWEEPMTCRCHQVTQELEVAMPTFVLGFKAEPVAPGEEGVRQEFAADAAAEALFGESSPLYLELYRQGLIDGSFGGGFETLDGGAMLTCSGDSDHPQAVADAIFAQAARLAREGIDEDTFRRIRRGALGRRIRSLDSFDTTCFRTCADRLWDTDYFRFPEIWETVTAEEARQFLERAVTPERAALSVAVPYGG